MVSAEAVASLDFDVLLEIAKNSFNGDVFNRAICTELRSHYKAAMQKTQDEDARLALSQDALHALRKLLKSHLTVLIRTTSFLTVAQIGQLLCAHLTTGDGIGCAEDILRMVIEVQVLMIPSV